jgi:hypothetical protein
MKKPLATLVTLVMIASPGAAFAASSVELIVKGLITPSACTPTLSANGIVDHGKISVKDLNQDTPTQLPNATLQMNVNCDAQTLFALNGIDNRVSSTTSPYGYGLGLIDNTQKIGYYSLEFSNVVADTQSIYPVQSYDGGQTWVSIDRSAWEAGTLAGFGIDIGNDKGPIPIQDMTTDLIVWTQIAPANGLNLANEVQLDGSATIEVKYL